MSAFSSGKAGMKSWGENGNQRKAAFSKKAAAFPECFEKSWQLFTFPAKADRKS